MVHIKVHLIMLFTFCARFSIVCHPVTYSRKRARKNLWIASASLWFISLVLVVPIMVFAQIDFHGYCNIEFPVDKVGDLSGLFPAFTIFNLKQTRYI